MKASKKQSKPQARGRSLHPVVRQKKVSIEFSLWDLITIHRFLIRGGYCAKGECRAEIAYVWYFINPILGKIRAAMKSVRPNT